MKTRGQVHEAVRRHRMAVDLVLAAAVLLIVYLMASKHTEATWSAGKQTGPIIALEALIFVMLLMRRGRPVLALAVIVASATLVMLLLKGWSPVAIVAVVAVFTVSVKNDRRIAVLAGVGSGCCLVFGGALRTGDWLSSDSISTLAWCGFAAALGQAIQSQKAYVAAIEERARRAEQTREEEAGRRVIEERLRIARELHDVVAHHIAVIQVQSGVVDHLLTDRPDAAREALGHVRRSSKMVLEELSGLLDVLRQPDDPLTPTEPAPGLTRLTSLIDQFAASGLKVDWSISGTPQALPTAVDLVAYRLIQEGLTNAHKHGTGSAEMVLGFEPGVLVISLVNRVAVSVGAGGGPGEVPDAAPSLGHGLSGMHERAHAVGGSVSAARQPDGNWRVAARLPLDGQVEAAPNEHDSSAACRKWPRS
jgi:signal transduction histidine kinase